MSLVLELTPPPEPAAPKAPRRRPLTPAQTRALSKAVRAGTIRRRGGYGPRIPGGAPVTTSPGERVKGSSVFDRGDVVDRLWSKGLLAPGQHHNTFVPTDRGRLLLAALYPHLFGKDTTMAKEAKPSPKAQPAKGKGKAAPPAATKPAKAPGKSKGK